MVLTPGQRIPGLIVCCTVCNIISPPTEMCSVEPPPPLACPGTGNAGMTPPLDPTVGPHRHRPHHRETETLETLVISQPSSPPGAANAEFLSSRHIQVYLYSCSFEIVDSGHNIGRNILLSYQMRARPSVYVYVSPCPYHPQQTAAVPRTPHRHRRLSPQQTLGPDTSPHVRWSVVTYIVLCGVL